MSANSAIQWTHHTLNFWWGCTKVSPACTYCYAAVRYLSCEPLLGAIIAYDALTGENCNGFNPVSPRAGGPRIHWVIAGGESGPNARPSHPDWFRSLRDQCAASGTPFFFKQWGEWVPNGEPTGNELLDARSQRIVSPCGHQSSGLTPHKPGAVIMLKLDTNKTGNHLDGRQHLEFPTPP